MLLDYLLNAGKATVAECEEEERFNAISSLVEKGLVREVGNRAYRPHQILPAGTVTSYCDKLRQPAVTVPRSNHIFRQAIGPRVNEGREQGIKKTKRREPHADPMHSERSGEVLHDDATVTP
jgi:hypothetical protein